MGEAERQQDQLAAGWKAIERDPRSAEAIARMALKGDSPHIEFARLLGASLFLQDRFREAIEPFREVFQKARTAGAGYHLGHCYLAVGDPENASAVLEQVVREFPQMVQAHDLLGVSLAQQSRHREALAHFAFAIERSPQDAEAHNNMGNALSELGRYEEAISYLEKATALNPDDPHAHNNLGNALFKLHRSDEAIASYRKAIELAPDYARAHGNLGAALVERNRNEEAIVCCEKTLAIEPNHADAHITLGLAYQGLTRFDEAIAHYQKALAIRPESAEAHTNIGLVYQKQKLLEEAIACHQKALSLKPDYAEPHTNLGLVYQEQGRPEEALACHRRAIALKPDLAHAHLNLGFILQNLKRHEEAIDSFQRVLAIEPHQKHAFAGLLQSELASCRWDDFSARIDALGNLVREGLSVADPYVLLAVSQNLEEQRLCAERFTADKLPWRPAPLWRGERYRHPKIRIAYLSADFREHAVAHCIRELFGLHDRSRFEIVGVSFGVDDGSEMRSGLAGSVDRFFDVRTRNDLHAAGLVRDLEVDIAIDLMGHTWDSRPGIFALRPAPVQVSYLGFAGTMGAEFIDYILADKFVLPEEHQKFYSEKAAYLPDCYQANDSKREIAERIPARGEVGLPQSGFVFCCFNNNHKIVPAVFEVWMRLLRQVPGSVLWVLEDNVWAGQNLRREAKARGIDPGRLILMQRVNIADYRARYRLADLFLDTLPYTGHGTASDALWAGLPVLTCAGKTFAGRVAGSLLRAVGLPELVTYSLEEYEALALKLARDPALLKELRKRLERNRVAAPLFNTDRFRRHIESAYVTMWEIWQRGEKPRAFAVAPIE